MNSHEDYYSLGNIYLNLKRFFKYLSNYWYFFPLAVAMGLGTGYVWCSLQKPHYIAETTFILEEKSPTNGGLAGLASQFGFNVGLVGGGGIFSGDNILNILKSKKVVEQVLLTPVDNNTQTLADFYLDFNGYKKKWALDNRLSKINFSAISSNDPVQDSVLNAIYERFIRRSLVTERVAKQSTIIKVRVTETNPLFSRLMSERLVDEAGKLYLEVRTGTAQANIIQLQRRSDSLLILLNRKSYTAASSQPLDANPGIKTATVPLEIASRDKSVIATLYAEVTKNLEASKMLLSQQTPVIQQLDRPTMLLDDNKKSLTFLIIVSSIVWVGLFVMLAFAIFIWTKIRSSAKAVASTSV